MDRAKTPMTYRKDIDGLRAIAIGSVLLFHAGFRQFAGGFVGVDIFFVISGYLITSILLAEIREERFSLMRFYQRRILRILPALSVVLCASLLLAGLLMFPNEFAATGKSLLAAALLSSNIFFWKTANYFDGADTLKPLLQTWSLGVEEQFYVLFPLVLLGAWRWMKDRLVSAIWALAAVSFAACLYQTRQSPSTAFYMLPARMWELSLGAIVAAGGAPNIADSRVREGIGAICLGLFAFAVFKFDSKTPFPGYAALAPCLGSAGLIAYGEDTKVGRLLSTRPMVALGLISYSLYLWHWPVLMFLRYQLGEGHRVAMLGGLAVSIALGALSYKFVESPFRARRFREMPAKRVVSAGVAGIAALSILGAVAFVRPWPLRYSPEVARIAAFADYRQSPDFRTQFRVGTCFLEDANSYGSYDKANCLRKGPGKRYLVLGDSHAAHLWKAIAEVYPDATVNQASASSCIPKDPAEGSQTCRDMMADLFRNEIPGAHFDAIFLLGHWSEKDLEGLPKTIGYLKRYTNDLIVCGPTVEYAEGFPRLYARSLAKGREAPQSLKGPKELDRRMEALVRNLGAHYVSIYDLACGPAEPCRLTSPEGEPMQFDSAHLTLSGARLVARGIRELIPNP